MASIKTGNERFVCSSSPCKEHEYCYGFAACIILLPLIFSVFLQSYGDLKTQLEIRQKKLEQFNVTAQPLAVIIKETGKNKSVKYKSLVKFDNFEFNGLESPLKAVDLAFKSYHALHACYPAESEPMWFFLQKAVYQFTTKWDKHYDIVEILVKEFQKFN